MYPREFEYYTAKSVDDALTLLGRHEESKVLAGGQSLIALMKLRLAAPAALVDIGRIPDLAYVRPSPSRSGEIEIGALTTHDTVAHSELLERECPILPLAARHIADQQIRNVGTIGGSCCHADPASDLPPTLRALDATFTIVGRGGSRTVPADLFFVGLFETAVRPDEILTEVRVPRLPARWGWHYTKFNRRHGDYPIVGVAIVLRLKDRSSAIAEARIGLAAVGPTPWRAKAAEAYLRDREATPEVAAEAAEKATEGLEPGADIHGSAPYRTELVRVLVRRGIPAAVQVADSRSGGLP